jgi:hypothetical protein
MAPPHCLDPIRGWGALAPPGLTLPWAGGRQFPSWDSTSGPSALAYEGRSGHRLVAPRCDPQVPAARAGGWSRWAGAERDVAGVGVPSRLAGSAASRSPPFPSPRPGVALLTPPGGVLSTGARKQGQSGREGDCPFQIFLSLSSTLLI